MPKKPTIDEVVQRAQASQDKRLAAVRRLAEGRAALERIRDDAETELARVRAEYAERIAAAERDDVRAWTAATTSGWTEQELKKLGLDEPDKRTRARRRQAPAASAAQASHDE